MATATMRNGTHAAGANIASAVGDSNSNATASCPAVESAVDAHASRILSTKSPAEACIDPSLGPYVTSILRCSLAESNAHPGKSGARSGDFELDVENEIPEFESLVELLEEHCSMSTDDARCALQSIFYSVRTGVVDVSEDVSQRNTLNAESLGGGRLGVGSLGSAQARPFRSESIGSENAYVETDAINLLGEMLKESDIGVLDRKDVTRVVGSVVGANESESPDSSACDNEEVPAFILDEDEFLQSTGVSSNEEHDGGLRCNELPAATASTGKTSGDYGGGDAQSNMHDTHRSPRAVENLSTPSSVQSDISLSVVEQGGKDQTLSNSTQPVRRGPGGKSKKKSKSQASDLAAALFRPARPRSNSNISDPTSPKMRPLSGPSPEIVGASVSSSNGLNIGNSSLFRQQLDSAAHILLSMNPELSNEAADEAALVSNADVNIAQYVLDGAMSAPPVCRHMLNDGCYRSDCQFSHDVEGHTCMFWLRGRCGKGETCRFLHGFSEKLLGGIRKDFLPEHHQWEDASGIAPSDATATAGSPSQSIPIQTTNLVEHNLKASFSGQNRESSPFSFLSSSFEPKPTGAGIFDTSSPYSLSIKNHSSHYGSPTPASTPLQASVLESMTGRTGSQSGFPSESFVQRDTVSFASVASKGYNTCGDDVGMAGALGASSIQTNMLSRRDSSSKQKFATIPRGLWTPSENRDASLFYIPDPMQRYKEVSSCQLRQDVIDLHFQSMKTFEVVLSSVLPGKLRERDEVWVVTGTGHHVGRSTHQKSGGVLENAVFSWLQSNGYDCLRGKDRNGYGGAILVRRR